MAEFDCGMDRAAMKALLAKSKSEPVNVAMGKAKEAAFAYLLMDKIKAPKRLEGELSKKFPELKDARWGTAFVDTDENAKLVQFRINKPSSGMAKRVAKMVKLAGYSKVRFEFEDGSAVEEDGEEDEEEAQASAPTLPQPEPEPAQPSQGAPEPVQPDARTLVPRLNDAAHRIPEALAKDPTRKDYLLTLARQAQALIAANDYPGTLDSIESLEEALSAPVAKKEPISPNTGAVTYAKSRLAWISVRRMLGAETEKLRLKMLEFYKARGVDIGADLNRSFNERVNTVMAALDEELADVLDDATNATDPAVRAKLVQDARAVIKQYQDFIASESLLSDLDNNPFEKLTIKATVSKTLETLSAAIR